MVSAHPDDETFGPGGTIARYADAGHRVVLLCATRGEAGKPGTPPVCTIEELPAIRERELRQAAATLGIAEVVFLGYHDGQVSQVPEDEAARLVAGLILRHAARVVITFPPGGLSGHADHIAVSRFASQAFHQARATGLMAGQPGPERLYYWTSRAERLERIFKRPPFHPLDATATALLDVAPWVERKLKAIRCHRSQNFSIEKVFGQFEPEVLADLRQERFCRVYPEPVPGELEDDLWG